MAHRVKSWTMTPTNFKALGLEFDSGVLVLPDPSIPLRFAGRHWSPSDPPADGNGDRTLERGITYEALNMLLPFALGDYTFSTYIKFLAGSGNSYPSFKQHYDPLMPAEHLEAYMYFAGSTSMRQYIKMNDGATRVTVINNSSVTYSWPQDVWKRLEVRVVGNTIRFNVYDEVADTLIMSCFCDNLDMDETDLGTCTMGYTQGWDLKWVVGGGDAGTRDWPRIYQPDSGTATLNTKWTLAANFVAFRNLTFAYSDTYDSARLCMPGVGFEYNLNDAGWVTVPDGGDMSGVSAEPGDVIDIRITLDNEDHHLGRPGVGHLNLSYEVGPLAEGVTMVDILAAIKNEIDNDPTITGMEGWDPRGAIRCHESSIDQIPLQSDGSGGGPAGVYVCPVENTEAGIGTALDDDVTEQTAIETKLVTVHPCVMRASSNPEDVTIAEEGVNWLTEKVEALLKRNNLDGLVRWIDYAGTRFDTQTGKRAGSVYEKRNTILLSVVVGPAIT